MNYEQKYKEALEKAKNVHALLKRSDDCKNYSYAETIEDIFPELRESEDERIRKFISQELACLRANDEKGSDRYEELTDAIVWFEKQGEQKPIDMIEPKFKPGDRIVEKDIYECGSGTIKEIRDGKYIFEDNCFIYIKEQDLWQLVKEPVEPKLKVGDWVVNKLGHVWHINSFDKKNYHVSNGDKYNYFPISKQDEMHLWTINDAEDGDVLYTSSTASNEVFIFKGLTKEGYIDCYCSYDSEDKYCEGKHHFIGEPTFMTHPATKEKCDLLFQKMKEAGYEWDADKKELKKIEQNHAWDEEDEKIINDAIWLIEHYATDGHKKLLREQTIDKLKSIKHQKHWKPSEEQMNALDKAKNSPANYYDTRLGLQLLYNDLLKL